MEFLQHCGTDTLLFLASDASFSLFGALPISLLLSSVATVDLLSWVRPTRESFFHSKEEQLVLPNKSSRKPEKVSLIDICRSATPKHSLPHPLLLNGHLQTFWTVFNPIDIPIYYKRKIFKSDSLAYPGHFAVDFVVPRFEMPNGPQVIDAAGRFTLPGGLPPRTALFTEYELSKLPSDDIRPMLVVLHGLSGGSHEEYLRQVLAPLSAKNSWQICVVNSRGCSQSKITSGVLYNARTTWDVRQVVKWLETTFPNRPLFGIGFSLGANMLATVCYTSDTEAFANSLLLKYLGEEGENCKLKAAVLCANPWNLEICDVHLQKSWLGQEVYSKTMAKATKRLFEQYVYLNT